MSDDEAAEVDDRVNGPERIRSSPVVKRIVLVIALAVIAFVVYKIGAAFLPRWWAHRVGDQVDGRISRGVLWGLFWGFVFSFVPVLLLFQVRRRFLSWTARGVVAVVAVVLAGPNWLTLSVVAGNSHAAHAGERIFDVEAPGFRWSTLIGVVAGVLLALVLSTYAMLLTRRRHQVKDLKGQISARDAQEKAQEKAQQKAQQKAREKAREKADDED